ncbi:glycoside hydrolase [Burkholderia metallica]|uniref:glycoside hydrolase n=1 Tax=Burkholderia metallica TaxID=488729 RepID=UPI001F5B7703|nr:glycoside hydrolase [Burkholderia metallica]
MARIDAATAGGANRVAFLDVVAVNEIGQLMLARSDDGYDLLASSTPSRLRFFKRHGEDYAGFPDPDDPSFPAPRAGRYRISGNGWAAYQSASGARDFGPIAQDQFALEQMRVCGALTLIDAGRFAEALACASVTWPSLSGTNADRDAQLLATYVRAGGQTSEAQNGTH